MGTTVRGVYTPPTCTNLNQVITRTSYTVPFTPMILNNTNIGSEFTLSVVIDTTNPLSISLTSDLTEVSINRISNDEYIISSTYVDSGEGVSINNHAYFSYLLRHLTLVTTAWPADAADLTLTLTDGTTYLSGLVSVSSLSETLPVDVYLTYIQTSRSEAQLSWTASTQVIGPGIAGYAIYKNGVQIDIVGSTTLNYDVIFDPDISEQFNVRAFSASSPPVYSEDSNSVVFSPKFMSVKSAPGTNTDFLFSYNGTTWNSLSIGDSGPYSGVYVTPAAMLLKKEYYNDTFSSTALYSYNGLTWTPTVLPYSNTYTYMYDVGDKFLLTDNLQSTNFFYSDDGINWNPGTFPITPGGVLKIAYSEGKWAAIVQNISTTLAITSDDGINWVIRNLPSSQVWHDIKFGGNILIATSSSSTNGAISSDFGATWLPISIGLASPMLAFDNNTSSWMATSKNGTSVSASKVSTNGVAWTNVTGVPLNSGWFPATSGNNRWVVNSNNKMYYCTTAAGVSTWTECTIQGAGVPVGEAKFLKDRFFINASGDLSGKFISYDGITWTYQVLAPVGKTIGAIQYI